ncbi:MCE family protein MceA [Nocardia nova SH22a]|uniref:MCE family protein MceA n=1 Tax=Nocardia nova SH22a TaxID=1415166 RepID=W5TFI0_9NOCA|nr:MCE family protein [Nocardia nova]AHH17763.1 MCE family protein MceA [Nocardia nova SH22a]
MLILFDTDGRGPAAWALVLRGVATVCAAALVVGVLLLKSTGAFDSKVQVTAVLTQLGDGLPARSDVKFRGALIGTVAGVTPSVDGGPNRVRIELDPRAAAAVPRTVTARVVPSNVFAVSSIQLVDNGPAPGLRAHDTIAQDRGLSTVQLETALTKLRDIVSATGRLGTDTTVGVLATVARATDRKGDSLLDAGRRLGDIVSQLNTLVAPDGGPSTIGEFTDAVRGLGDAAPDLLDALHHSVISMRTLAEQNNALTTLLAAGNSTSATVADGLGRHSDQLVTANRQMAPVLDVWGAGSSSFTEIVTVITRLSGNFTREFWKTDRQVGLGKFVLELTPHQQYTRADCPRYGDLAGPSCSTAPVSVPLPALPPVLDPRTFPVPAPLAHRPDLLTPLLGLDPGIANSPLAQILSLLPPGGAR